MITAANFGPLLYDLRDDDRFVMPVDLTDAAVLRPFVDEMNRVYSDAYIEAFFDGGASPAHNKVLHDYFDLRNRMASGKTITGLAA